ncbi:MAG: imidazolonepropionase [Bacteroidetes bacterium CG12_big_fil_rev_8_21_14_0_65_60_17]|nr:MAG: imidazolonepropionase [Bacteroidetes bacterium CG12_big_fil_rev_8_21_14_0_65_60_17]
MPEWDVLITNVHLATMTGPARYGAVHNGAIALEGDTIAWVGPLTALPAGEARDAVDGEGRWITPALIDCHTHLVFGGSRAEEYEERLGGASYGDIARRGGGIMSSVRATRTASLDALVRAARPRLGALMADGCATVEIKSGYGLDRNTELRMLRAATELGREAGISVRRTLLAAHALPPEFEGRMDAYVDLICDEILPAAHTEGLVDMVDAYLESIAFGPEQVDRMFTKARTLGLPVRLHADQLSSGGGAGLAARHGALSADHLEYSSEAGVRAMAAAGCVAVLLPGAFLVLGETQAPPVAAMRREGVPIAVATDCNPGTSPVASLRSAMSLAAALFGLTPEECLRGATQHAARALGLADRGVLAAGRRADLAIWNVDHPRDLTYWLGTRDLETLWVGGAPQTH